MTLSHLTVSEVNGGLDGLLLGNHFRDRLNDAPKLSQILGIYYQGSGHKNRYTNITHQSDSLLTTFAVN